jgi:hypothetical protein
MVWDVASPPTIQEMLLSISKTEKVTVKYHSRPAQITGHRMKKIAGELTGGKMD